MNKLVSVIVPIYNVEKELEICLKSILEQTYSELEIILINDGSTDRSDVICRRWADKDNRIKYVNKKNEGVSTARNLGIKMSAGEYLAFVDPDDWVERTFIEKMYGKAKSENADMAICDYYEINGSIKKYYTANMGNSACGNGDRRVVSAGVNIWTKLIRRKILTDNDILMPKLPYEDFAVHDVIVFSCKKIVCVNEALYFYRSGREGSATAILRDDICFPQTTGYLIKELKDRGLYEENKTAVTEQIISHMRNHYLKGKRSLPKEEFYIMEEEFFQFLRQNEQLENYYNLITKKVKVWGSYSLGRMANYFVWNENAMEDKYNFSSIISSMSERRQKKKIFHANPYRRRMIEQDLEQSFWTNLENTETDFLLIDLLEERFNILNDNGQFFTESDAWKECSEAKKDNTVILRYSKECENLWKAACDKFVKRLKRFFKPKQVVLVKNYLFRYVGNTEQQILFEGQEDIEYTNRMLDSYYQYFIESFEGIHIIENTGDWNYTDRHFAYGAYPWHYNQMVYMDTAFRIVQQIGCGK